ncbi:MAG: TonB-dependent receptor [Tannerella sp.]|nr:TonB-dependent receptor [Tannerella sp.]
MLLTIAISSSLAFAEDRVSETMQAKRQVSGIVTNATGEPVIGANIIEKGAVNGTATDTDGRFSLLVAENAVLQVSFIGYISQEIATANQSVLNVTLLEDSRTLDEIVVVGYGTQKKVNLTGAVDVITNERLAQRPSGNVSQSIRGLAPGMNFSLNNAGFQPGADMSVTVRGVGSLNGGSPYILIDGFPGDMNLLNPDDIESISILKDAASSAIYGARAPYGVILITTKNGKKSEKIKATYSGQLMVNSAQKLPTPLDSWTYTRVQNEAGRNAGGTPFSEAIIDRIVAFQNQDWNRLRQLLPDYPAGADITSGAFPNGNTWDSAQNGYANNNWWDIYYGNSVNQKHDLSLQGGTDKASYYFSGGFLDQDGVLNYGNDIFQRMNLLGKLNIVIADWWDFSYETRFSQKYRERSSYWNGGGYTNMLNYTTRWVYPFSPLYDGWGNYAHASMIPYLLSGTEKNKNLDYWNNFRTEIRPLKGWKINADFAYNTQSHNTANTHLSAWEYHVDNTPFALGETKPTNLAKTKYDNYYWNTNIFTTYEFDIAKDNHFSVMAGMQFEKGTSDQVWGYKTDLIVEAVPSFQTATGSVQLSESLGHNATQGYFGRLNYNFRNKYMLELNARYDGTYVFRSGNRWGFFPSASVGWNLHGEQFWKSIEPYVNTLKVKASWGQLGNQNVSPYTDLELIPIQTGQLGWIFSPGGSRRIGYTSAPGIVNRNLTWETSTSKNLGFETSFLQNRLSANINVFENVTTDMIGPSEAKPGVLGASVPNTNNATLRTRGWDVSLNWKHRINSDFSYFLNLNLSDYTSVVTKYNNPTGTLSTWYEGKAVGEIWGYTVNDLFRTQADLDAYLAKTDLTFLGATWRTGDVKYEDINGDGKVNNGTNTVSDHGDLSIIGNDQPHYITGLTVGFNYRGFDFSTLWTGLKRDIWFGSNGNLYWGFNSSWWEGNLQTRNLDYFRDEPGTTYYGLYEGDANINTDSWWPRPYLNGTEQNKNANNANTRYLVNGSYLRLSNVQLGYTLPRSLTSKLYLANVRFFFSGENLLTFSKLPAGIDPEIPNGASATYGADRVCSFGLTVTY